jgi:hypothetical protein
LVRRNIRIIRLSDKLDYRKFGPFKIVRCIKGTSFELQLLPIMRIYLVFYIFLLEPVYPETPEGPTPEISQETREAEYEVERILDVTEKRKQLR